MLKILFFLFLTGSCTDLFAQKRLLVGGNVGTTRAYMDGPAYRFESANTGWYGGAHLDYQITSRLSLNTQLHYQTEKYKTLQAGAIYQDVQFNTKRLLVGFTEYLPIGNHALYSNIGLTVSHYSAKGNANGSASSTQLYDETGFKPLQMGWGFHLGYMFRFGLSIQTGYLADFKPTYNNFGSLRHQQFQLVQLGYLVGFNKRDRMDNWNRKKRKR